jgi:hypothetical protein
MIRGIRCTDSLTLDGNRISLEVCDTYTTINVANIIALNIFFALDVHTLYIYM